MLNLGEKCMFEKHHQLCIKSYLAGWSLRSGILDCCLQIWAAARQNQQNYLFVQRRQISLGIRTVWSVFAVRSMDSFRTQGFFMRTAKTEQTGRMYKLIWVFIGRTCYFDGFVVLPLRWSNFISYPSPCLSVYFTPLHCIAMSLCKIPRSSTRSLQLWTASGCILPTTPRGRGVQESLMVVRFGLKIPSPVRVTVRHQEACRVMPNSYPEWRKF